MTDANLLGQTFGHWEVVERAPARVGRVMWKCQCTCGRLGCKGGRVVRAAHLLSGASQSCGVSSKIEDLRDRQFGTLTAKNLVLGGKRAKWRCVCTCGENDCKGTVVVDAANLKRGMTSTCGCTRNNPARSVLTALLDNYQRGSATRGVAWQLSREQFIKLIQQPCHYCGALVEKTIRRRYKVAVSGIDRIDNRVGYTPANCVPCCSRCNYAKHTMTVEEFTTWVKSAYEFLHLEST